MRQYYPSPTWFEKYILGARLHFWRLGTGEAVNIYMRGQSVTQSCTDDEDESSEDISEMSE